MRLTLARWLVLLGVAAVGSVQGGCISDVTCSSRCCSCKSQSDCDEGLSCSAGFCSPPGVTCILVPAARGGGDALLRRSAHLSVASVDGRPDAEVLDLATGAPEWAAATDAGPTPWRIALTADAALTGTFYRHPEDSPETVLVDVGEQSGAEYICEAPAGGYEPTASIQRAHGYVSRSRDGRFARVFVHQVEFDQVGSCVGAVISWIVQTDGAPTFPCQH